MDILERVQRDKVVKNWQFWDDIKYTKTTGTPSRVKAYLGSKGSRTILHFFLCKCQAQKTWLRSLFVKDFHRRDVFVTRVSATVRAYLHAAKYITSAVEVPYTLA